MLKPTALAKPILPFLIAVFAVLALLGVVYSPTQAQEFDVAETDAPDSLAYDIETLYADLSIVGETVVVTGDYVAWETKFLATNYELFLANMPVDPYEFVVLTGTVPDLALNRSSIIVTGTLESYTPDYAYLGVDLLLRIAVSESAQLAPPPPTDLPDPPPPGQVSAAEEPNATDSTNQNGDEEETDCSCQWAIITSGGINDANNHRRYRNDVEYKWHYKNEVAGYPDDCIDVFYYDGDGDDLPSVNNDRVMTASQTLIEERLRELAPEMLACRDKGIKPTLQFLVTDHGGGYHSAVQGTAQKKGLRGGKIDTDGDEGGDVDEDDFKIDASSLSPGFQYRYDIVDGDNQDPDTVVLRTAGGDYEVYRCLNPACTGFPPGGTNWQTVTVASTAGGMLVGIDVDGDGNTAGSVGVDEVIYLLGDDTLSDDELTDALRPLCPSGVDLYIEMGQCYSGGFAEDLARLRAEGCHIHFAAAASEEEVSWGWDSATNPENGYDYYERYFIDSLIASITGTNEVVSPTAWIRADDHARDYKPDPAQPIPPARRHNTNPTSDIDCLVMFGPYVREDGKICLRYTNYCTEELQVNGGLNTHNFGIGASPLGQRPISITLAPGESEEICIDPPAEGGNYCFHGFGNGSSTRAEFRTRWLNNVEIDVPVEQSNAPINIPFEVGGWQQIEFPYIWLAADRFMLPPGWEYELSHQVIQLPPPSSQPIEPIPVTAILYPPLRQGNEIVAAAEISESVQLRVVGWGLFEDPGDTNQRPPGAAYVSDILLQVNIVVPSDSRIHIPWLSQPE